MAADRRGHRRERGTGRGLSEPQREIRFGLVLYGGVSLAIYIYGVAREFERLVRASRGVEENAWSALLAAADASATVDIVSGASAGGINGILLGKALAGGGDLRSVRSLWVEQADIAKLMRAPSDADPRSLLRSDLFEKLVGEGLAAMDREGDGEPVVGVFDLFASGTRIRPWVRDFGTDLGGTIRSGDYREGFRLRYRRSGYNAEAPDLGYDQNDFAGAGNARLVEVARATSAFPGAFEPVEHALTEEEREADKPDPTYFSDGGILHNKPFTEAISTILTRAAGLPVRRWLVSVEPDPEHAAAPPAGPPEITEVVSKALFGIPRYQSVAGDLERLREHRENVARARAIISDLDAALATRVSRRRPGLRSLHDAIGSDYDRRRMEQLVDELASRTGAVATTLGAQLGARLDSLEQADAAFDRRRVQHLLELLRGDMEAARGDAELATFEELKLRLWAEADRIEDLLWRLTADRSRARLGFPDLGDALADGLAEIRRRTWVACAALDGLVGDRRSGAHPPYTVVFDEFELWDAVLLGLEQVSSVAARDTIRLARISPEDASFTGTAAADKLAGDTLAHFGGFLNEDWRTNDILWGRLDAAEQIVRILFEPLALDDAALAAHIRTAQEEIAREELPDLDGDYVERVNREPTVGSQTLAAVPSAQRSRLTRRAGRVTLKMLAGVRRRHPEDAVALTVARLGVALRIALAVVALLVLAVVVLVALLLTG